MGIEGSLRSWGFAYEARQGRAPIHTRTQAFALLLVGQDSLTPFARLTTFVFRSMRDVRGRTEVAMENPKPPCRNSHITLAPATALALLIAIAGVILSYGGLQTRLVTVEEQIRGYQGSRFTDKDYARERALIEKSLLEERVRTEADMERAHIESTIICESLSTLARDIGKSISLRCPITFRDAGSRRTR